MNTFETSDLTVEIFCKRQNQLAWRAMAVPLSIAQVFNLTGGQTVDDETFELLIERIHFHKDIQLISKAAHMQIYWDNHQTMLDRVDSLNDRVDDSVDNAFQLSRDLGSNKGRNKG